jgi:hypothetical protein
MWIWAGASVSVIVRVSSLFSSHLCEFWWREGGGGLSHVAHGRPLFQK